MGFIGGDITEISYNHPVLGSSVWFIKSGEDSTFDPGGFRKNDDVNMIAGNGAAIHQINRVRWSLECTVAWDINGVDELSQAEALAASPVDAEWTFTHSNGSVWGGVGSPVGDIQGNGNAATFTIKISGGQKLTKIVS